ncbi:MAG: thioesterase family protein [Flammeovirgaceae bacterium]|nr:MAG: thioesterase family protein [Flammeovirgaceae bacterium]
MPRIHLVLPETFNFICELPVRVSDLNYGGHVGNDSFLTIMQEARVLYYRQLGFQSELSLEGTIGQIITDAAVVYKSESFLGDVLTIEIAATDFTKYGFDLMYRLRNKATGKDVAYGKTGVVCFDYAVRKVTPVPEPVKRKLQLNSEHTEKRE